MLQNETFWVHLGAKIQILFIWNVVKLDYFDDFWRENSNSNQCSKMRLLKLIFKHCVIEQYR